MGVSAPLPKLTAEWIPAPPSNRNRVVVWSGAVNRAVVVREGVQDDLPDEPVVAVVLVQAVCM